MNIARIQREVSAIFARMITVALPYHESEDGPDGKVYRLTENQLATALVDAVDVHELGRAAVRALLTEETTDEVLDGLLARVDLPWYVPTRIVRRELDKRLPEALRDPLLDLLDRSESEANGGTELGGL